MARAPLLRFRILREVRRNLCQLFIISTEFFRLGVVSRVFVELRHVSVSRNRHEGPILAAQPPPGANLILSFVVLLT
jgi:hypothetical protein